MLCCWDSAGGLTRSVHRISLAWVEMLLVFLLLQLHYWLLVVPVAGETTDAQCSTDVTVTANGAAAGDCSSGSLANRTCSSLQDVLHNLEENAASNSSEREPESASLCVQVRLLPGRYVLTRNFTLVGVNLKLVGDEGDMERVNVSFDLSRSFDPTQTHSPLYVLSIVNSSLVEISGISFWGSPGIITAHNVETVLVEKCSFRYRASSYGSVCRVMLFRSADTSFRVPLICTTATLRQCEIRSLSTTGLLR